MILMVATSLAAQQNAAPSSATPAAGSPATSATAPATTQPSTTAPAAATPQSSSPAQPIIERQQITIQKVPGTAVLAIPAASQPVAAKANPQPASPAPATASAQPSTTPSASRPSVVTPATIQPQERGRHKRLGFDRCDARGLPTNSPSEGSSKEVGSLPPTPPGSPIIPQVSKSQAAEARKQFAQGVKLKKDGHLDQAFSKFSSAAELDPTKLDYVTAREFTREELAYRALQRGNKAMLDNNEIVAMAEFRRALDYDPTNDYALQRLRDAIPETDQPKRTVSVVEQSLPVELNPSPKHHDFAFRGDSRTMLTEVMRAYGIKAQFDDSVKTQHLHFNIQDVNFATALQAACEVTKTFWVPLSPTQVLFLLDNVENRRNFERMGLRTFYLPELTDQQLSEMTNSLRVLLNLRFIALDKSASTITIRAEMPLLDAADRLLRSLTTGRAEVLLDLRIYAVSTSLARSLGTALPTQFTMFNFSPALLAGLGAGASNLINQLISSGGINAANSTAVSALLGQLQNSSTSSILTQPFVTFGGGLTTFGLNGGGVGLTPTFSLNTSDIKNLEHLMLRASHNDPAVAEDRRALSHHQCYLRAHLQHRRRLPRSSATAATSRLSRHSTLKTSG